MALSPPLLPFLLPSLCPAPLAPHYSGSTTRTPHRATAWCACLGALSPRFLASVGLLPSFIQCYLLPPFVSALDPSMSQRHSLLESIYFLHHLKLLPARTLYNSLLCQAIVSLSKQKVSCMKTEFWGLGWGICSKTDLSPLPRTAPVMW